MKRPFPSDDKAMASEDMKRCSTSQIVRKMQVKTTRRYLFTSVMVALIKKSRRQVFGRDVEKLETCALLVGMGSVQPLWKTVWRFLKKFIIELCIQKFHF